MPHAADSINCDFQTDMCDWSASGNWTWAVQKGPSGKPNTGPLADHNADGRYTCERYGDDERHV